MVARFCLYLATRQATVTYGFDPFLQVLILLLQLETRRQLTLATKRQMWHS